MDDIYDITKDLTKPGQTSLLPQYFYSDCMFERFLDATQCEADEISRAESIKGQTKTTEDYEIEHDNLEFFVERKEQFEIEFLKELSKRITKIKATIFCKIISDNWYDGRAKRNSLPVRRLFASIKNYLLEYKKVTNEDDIRVIYDVDDKIKPNFNDDDIDAILEVNRQMFDGYISQWIEGHPNYFEMGSKDIYCRRGLFLEKPLDSEEYLEWNYINSYSIAFTVTEKFSQMTDKATPAILNTNLANLRDRILFFSPFIKNMPIGQFELGIIPHWWTLRISKQGTHGGIEEYLLD
jgi:hypothetical protein